MLSLPGLLICKFWIKSLFGGEIMANEIQRDSIATLPANSHSITSQHHPHAKKDLLCLAWHSATPPPLINLEFTYQKQGKEEEEKQGGQPGQSIFHLVLANSEHLSQAHRLAGVPGWAFNTLRPICLLPAITIIFFTVLSPCFSAPS